MIYHIPPFLLWREVGLVEWYVRDQGYAYVHMDVRGSGQSGGVYNFLDREEQQDYYECIEWVGRQDWCNGKVGGIGQSYYAWSQWFMGIDFLILAWSKEYYPGPLFKKRRLKSVPN